MSSKFSGPPHATDFKGNERLKSCSRTSFIYVGVLWHPSAVGKGISIAGPTTNIRKDHGRQIIGGSAAGRSGEGKFSATKMALE
jgi:hypothetical protein